MLCNPSPAGHRTLKPYFVRDDVSIFHSAKFLRRSRTKGLSKMLEAGLLVSKFPHEGLQQGGCKPSLLQPCTNLQNCLGIGGDLRA